MSLGSGRTSYRDGSIDSTAQPSAKSQSREGVPGRRHHISQQRQVETDQSEIGLYFVKKLVAESLKEPATLVGSIWMANYELDIAAGKKDYRRSTFYTLPREVIMVGVVPLLLRTPLQAPCRDSTRCRGSLRQFGQQPLQSEFAAETGDVGRRHERRDAVLFLPALVGEDGRPDPRHLRQLETRHQAAP